ncbi:DUF1499 domain-containing protein [Halomonas sp.]|uniref:DUF1499 domain-containing protein n=1 Tax=Halomonas sp. TaxID=1486246 RepID=UPI00356826A4
MTLIGMILLLLAALSIAAAGPAYRLGLLPLGDAFSMLRYGAFIGLAAAAIGLVAMIMAAIAGRLGRLLSSGLLVVASLVIVAVPWLQVQKAQGVPPIHDITTDTRDPPAFQALVPAREAAPNAVDYPGEATARQQEEAYPEIQPRLLDAPLERVREAAQAEILESGWELVAVTDTILEATATTLWFGFKDDVVVRLTDTQEGVRVDMRSASRLGTSDVGTNAARIQAYLAALARRLEN